MEVKVSRVSSVKPPRPTANCRMFLSCLDLVWRNVCFERLLFYRISPHNLPIIVTRLKSSLSSALVHFYPLAGRLVTGEKGKRPEIECNDGGVHFIEASIDIPFQDLEADYFQHTSSLRKLLHNSNSTSTTDSPLLSVQVTSFLGGGISVGCTMHHALADGVSIWHLMTLWAECSRGFLISRIPVHNRAIFKRDNFNKNSNIYDAAEMENIITMTDLNNNSDDIDIDIDIDAKLIYRTFGVSEKMIETLKALALQNGKGPYSSFVVVAAHFWRCMTKAREIAEQQDVNLCLDADSRIYLRPPLPANWLGNCVQFGKAQTTARELLSREFSFAVDLIHNVALNL
eukprot:Gb_25340 [translate_table: standard]